MKMDLLLDRMCLLNSLAVGELVVNLFCHTLQHSLTGLDILAHI